MKKSGNNIEISIIVVTYNCEAVIEDCIESCLSLVNQDEVEVVVLDNNSGDGTITKLSPYSEYIHLIQESENIGFTRGCQKAIDHATGKYIFLLNPDARLFPDTAHILKSKLDTQKEVGGIAPKLIFPDGTFQNYTRSFPTICGLWVEHFCPKKFKERIGCFRRYMCLDTDFSEERYVDQPAAAAFMFRRGIRMDEEYFLYVSDVALCKDIVARGNKILQTPDTKVIHLQSKGGTNAKDPKMTVFISLDNYYGMQRYFRKYSGSIAYWKYRIVFGLSLLLVLILSILRMSGTIGIKALRLKGFIYRWNLATYVNKQWQ